MEGLDATALLRSGQPCALTKSIAFLQHYLQQSAPPSRSESRQLWQPFAPHLCCSLSPPPPLGSLAHKTNPSSPPPDGVERSRLADARPLLQRQRGRRKRRSSGNPPAIAVSPSIFYPISRGPTTITHCCCGKASARRGGERGSSGSDGKEARLGGAGSAGVCGAFRGLPADGNAGPVRSGP